MQYMFGIKINATIKEEVRKKEKEKKEHFIKRLT